MPPETPTEMTFGPYTFALEMPDLPAVLLMAGRVPNPLIAAVVALLAADGAMPASADDPDFFARNIVEIRGRYAVLELCCVGINGDAARRFRAFDPPGPGDLGPRDVGLAAPRGVYWTFFFGGYRDAGAGGPADAADAGGAAQPAPDGDAVPLPAERAAGRGRRVGGVGDQ
jgi:hypothetical protein